MVNRKKQNWNATSRPVNGPMTRRVRVVGQVGDALALTRPTTALVGIKQTVLAEVPGQGVQPVTLGRGLDDDIESLDDDTCDQTLNNFHFCDLRKNHKRDHEAYDADGKVVFSWPIQPICNEKHPGKPGIRCTRPATPTHRFHRLDNGQPELIVWRNEDWTPGKGL